MFKQRGIIFLKPLIPFFLILLFMFPSGCASRHQGYSSSSYSSNLLKMQLEKQDFRQKNDRLLVLIDGQGDLNLDRAYKLLQGVKETIPSSVSYEKVFRINGWNVEPFSEDIAILFGLNQVPYQGIDDLVVTKTLRDSEINPLSISLDSLVMELAKVRGNNALIVISNGQRVDKEELKSARYLKEGLGDKICIYPILMGHDPEGEKSLQALAEIGGCGYLTRRENLLTAVEMTDFVRDIFFTGAEPLSVTTKEETPSLDKMLGKDKKIQFVLHVEFEFDKAKILPGFDDEIKKTAEFLQTYPQTKALLVGHTDSVGSKSYNRKLSLQRAEAVRQYLIDKYGIAKERLTAEGAGESEPVADNASEVGRQRNRRVVAIITRMVTEYRAPEK